MLSWLIILVGLVIALHPIMPPLVAVGAMWSAIGVILYLLLQTPRAGVSVRAHARDREDRASLSPESGPGDYAEVAGRTGGQGSVDCADCADCADGTDCAGRSGHGLDFLTVS